MDLISVGLHFCKNELQVFLLSKLQINEMPSASMKSLNKKLFDVSTCYMRGKLIWLCLIIVREETMFSGHAVKNAATAVLAQ